jgi:pimeloyl-ACP methyl ester carboxylesterase
MARPAVAEAMRRLLVCGGSAARSVTTTLRGRPLHHLEEGSHGRVIVLLHGGTGGGANWFRLLPRLAVEHRVLAPDLPGFGLSAPHEPRAPIGRQAAELLDEWLHTVGVTEALVVGTSFGGLAAVRLAQLTRARVSHLLLLNSAGLGRRIHPLVRLAALPGLTRLATRPSRRGTALLFRTLLTTDRSELTAAQITALLHYLDASARAAGTAYLARTLRLFVGPRGQREVVSAAELAALDRPVTVAWGERDPFLPLEPSIRAGALLPNVRFIAIPDAGHSPNWERADAVFDAIVELSRRTS